MKHIFTPISKGQKSNQSNTKRGKSNERTLLSEMVENGHREENGFLVLCNLLLMRLGQYQLQIPSVHAGGVSRGRISGFGRWLWGHVTCYR